MQFNSVQSGSFLTAAKSVTDAATEIYNTAQQTGFQVDTVIKQANANEALKKVAAARRNALMANTATKGVVAAKTEDIKTKRDKAIKDIMRPAVRMEGVNRMAGSVAAGAYIMDESKKARAEFAELKALRKQQDEAAEKRAEKAEERNQKLIDAITKKGTRISEELGNVNSSGNLSNISTLTLPGNASSNDSNPSPKQVFDYIKSKGVSDVHAKGILANIEGESSFQTGVMGDGGKSGGLFQMYDPKPGEGRFTNMVNNVPDWKTNWKGQIDHGLKDDAGPQYLNTKFDSPVQAANWFLRNYERPAKENLSGREELNKSFIGNLNF